MAAPLTDDPYDHPHDYLWRFQCEATPVPHQHSLLCFAPIRDEPETWLCVERTGGTFTIRAAAGEEVRISNLPGGPSHCFFNGTAGHNPECGEKILVDRP
jgi:hypothetical protein